MPLFWGFYDLVVVLRGEVGGHCVGYAAVSSFVVRTGLRPSLSFEWKLRSGIRHSSRFTLTIIHSLFVPRRLFIEAAAKSEV